MSPNTLWLYNLFQSLVFPLPLYVKSGVSELSVCHFYYIGNTHFMALNLNKFGSGPRDWTLATNTDQKLIQNHVSLFPI